MKEQRSYTVFLVSEQAGTRILAKTEGMDHTGAKAHERRIKNNRKDHEAQGLTTRLSERVKVTFQGERLFFHNEEDRYPNEEERLWKQEQEHLEAAARQRDLPELCQW
jgi:hypothetical protein